jgi:hypothetical protein
VESYYPAFFQEGGTAEAAWWSLRKLLATRDANQAIGSYVSGTRCQDAPPLEQFPQGIVDCCDIDPADPTAEGHEVLNPQHAPYPTRRIWDVNPADPKVAEYRALILREAARRNPHFMFLDNMMNIGYATEADAANTAYITPVIDHVRMLCRGLNALGFGTLLNIGKFPHGIAAVPPAWADFLDALGPNGIYMEDPYAERDSEPFTSLQMHKTMELLNRHCLVVLGQLPGDMLDPGWAQWMAAMAMAIRSDGHSLFVTTMVDNSAATNAWRTWPADRGPAGAYAYTPDSGSEWHVTRTLGGGDVTVVHLFAAPQVPGPTVKTLPPTVPIADFNPPDPISVLPDPLQGGGIWDPVAGTYTVGDPTRMHDRFVLFSRVTPAKPNQRILAVDVTLP